MFIDRRFLFVALVSSFLFFNSKKIFSTNFESTLYTHQVQPDTSTVKDILSEAQELIFRGEIATATKQINRAIFLSDSLNFAYGAALSEVQLADVYMYKQKHDSAITILQNAISKYPNSRARPYFYNQLGAVYNYISQPLKSIETYEKGLELIYLLNPDQRARTRAGMLVNMASAYKRLGDRENTFKNYLEGIRFAEASKDTIFLVITLNNLGDVYNSYDEYEKSTFYLNRALNLALEKDYKGELLRIYLNLGNSESSLENYDQALSYYNRALELNAIVRPTTPPFQILYNIGNLYLNTNNFQKAKEFFEESLKYCQQLNIPQGLYYNYKGLGDLYNKFSDTNKAIDFYIKALEVAKSLNLNEFSLELHEELYDSYKRIGQPEDALFHLEYAKTISDSINEARSESVLADLESTIELDRQTEINRLLEEKQVVQERQLVLRRRFNIAFLVGIMLMLALLYFVFKSSRERKKVNLLLNAQKQELEDLNLTKDKLFAIVAHDLRSPMASMQGILYLINNSETPPNEIKDLVMGLEPTLQKNVDTLDNLLAWARKQMSGISISVQKVDVYDIVETKISKQSQPIGSKKITIKNNIPQNTFIAADLNAFKLIIRNLLSNSLKFTKPEGYIEFNCNEQDDHIIISIKDSGIGIPDDVKSFIFKDNTKSRVGTNGENGNGFGLHICKEFATHMKGDLYFESSEDVGTTFYLKLPAYSKVDHSD